MTEHTDESAYTALEAQALMARAWDEALRHVWELNDPAYTILTDTESIHPLLTRNDVDQALRQNPYRLSSPGEAQS